MTEAAKVFCVECVRFDLRTSALARHSFGLCELAPKFEFHSATLARECQHHKPAPAATGKARREWLEKQQGKAVETCSESNTSTKSR